MGVLVGFSTADESHRAAGTRAPRAWCSEAVWTCCAGLRGQLEHARLHALECVPPISFLAASRRRRQRSEETRNAQRQPNARVVISAGLVLRTKIHPTHLDRHHQRCLLFLIGIITSPYSTAFVWTDVGGAEEAIEPETGGSVAQNRFLPSTCPSIDRCAGPSIAGGGSSSDVVGAVREL